MQFGHERDHTSTWQDLVPHLLYQDIAGEKRGQKDGHFDQVSPYWQI